MLEAFVSSFVQRYPVSLVTIFNYLFHEWHKIIRAIIIDIKCRQTWTKMLHVEQKKVNEIV